MYVGAHTCAVNVCTYVCLYLNSHILESVPGNWEFFKGGLITYKVCTFPHVYRKKVSMMLDSIRNTPRGTKM